MKNNFSLFCVFILFVVPNLGTDLVKAADATSTGPSLKNIVRMLSGGGTMVGMEVDCLCKDKLAPSVAGAFIKNRDFPALAKIIADETDYYCMMGKDYFVILPKNAPSQHDKPLALRIVSFPAVNRLSQSDFYQKISGVDPAEPAFLDPNSLGSPFYVERGTVTFRSQTGTCLDLLNQMASQLHARSWTIDHLFIMANGEKTPKLPVSLWSGDIQFDR